MTIPLAIAALALLLALPGAASARRYDVRVGIGDQSVKMFDSTLFQRLDVKRVRYFIPWNAANDHYQMDLARYYVLRARQSGIHVFVHISTDDLRIKHGHLPSVHAYRRDVGKIIRTLRPLGVTEWGVWDEANHASQPTWNHPARAASYFKAFRSMCRGCRIVALDVLDQRGVEGYISKFYRHLSHHLRREARYVGIHNYSDVNRHRTTGTRAIMRRVRHYNRHARFWLTETGGVVKFGRSFPCSTHRAARRLGYLFRIMKRYRHSIDRVYIYNWFGGGCHSRMDTGLVNPSGHRRATYTAVERGLRHFKR